MFTFFRRRWPIGLLACIHAFAAHAVNHEPATQSKLKYRSSLERYRSFTDESIQPWAETNEVVRKIGGWRAYAAERSTTGAEPQPESGRGHQSGPVRPEGGSNRGPGSKP